MCARALVAAAAEITFSIARRSATGGREATNEPKSRPDACLDLRRVFGVRDQQRIHSCQRAEHRP